MLGEFGVATEVVCTIDFTTKVRIQIHIGSSGVLLLGLSLRQVHLVSHNHCSWRGQRRIFPARRYMIGLRTGHVAHVAEKLGGGYVAVGILMGSHSSSVGDGVKT